jgi:hypothetical protein
VRNYLPSPAKIEEEMRNVRKYARALLVLTSAVEETYEDAYDASLRAGSNGEGIPAGRNGFRVSDPTGDVATSGQHAAMRSSVRRAAAKLKKCDPILEDALRLLHEAFAVGDPEHRQRMERLRALEAEMLPRHSHKR